MLKSIRSNIKKLHWILWIIILSFVLWGVGGISQLGGLPNNIIKSVEGIEVSFSDFELAYRRMVSFYSEMYGEQFSPQMVEQLNLKQSALSGVIEEAEKAALSKKAGFTVEDQELSNAIMEIPELQDEEGNFLGRDIYLQLLKMNNLSVSEFEGGLQRGLLAQKLNNYFQYTVIPSRADSLQKYIYDNTTRQFAYIAVNSRNLTESVEYTEEEIAEYFEANKMNYELPEQRVIEYIAFDPKSHEGEVENARDLLNEYYLSHREEFKQEEQVKASHILFRVNQQDPEDRQNKLQKALEIKKELDEGADFGLLARMYSEDPGTKEKSGDLGYFGRGKMVEAFEEAAFSLKTGQISDPVETSFGFHIIKVTDRKEEAMLSFEEASPRIDAKLRSIKADRIAGKEAEEFASGLIAREEFISKADSLKIRYNTSEPFFNKQTIPGIGYAKELVEQAFLTDVNAVSSPVNVRNMYYVFAVKEVIEPHIPGLDHEDTLKRVTEDYKKEKAKELALERAQKVQQLLADGVSLDEINTIFPDLKLEKKETGKLTAGSNVPGIDDKDKVLELFQINEDEVYGPVSKPDTGQYTLYYLADSSQPEIDMFDEKREELDDSLVKSRGFEIYRAWFDFARKDLDVRTNNALMKYIMEN